MGRVSGSEHLVDHVRVVSASGGGVSVGHHRVVTLASGEVVVHLGVKFFDSLLLLASRTSTTGGTTTTAPSAGWAGISRTFGSSNRLRLGLLRLATFSVSLAK
jgi:hypothetical protein